MWRQRSPQSRSCGPQTSAAPSCCKRMPLTQDLEPSCPRFRKVRSIRFCISAGSWPRQRGITPPWRRKLWPSSGQSWSCAITSWDVSSPSLRSTRLSSGWPGPRTRMPGWHDGSLCSRTSTSWCNIGLERPTPTASPGFGQLLQVCQGSLPTHPLCLPYYTTSFGQAQDNAYGGGGGVWRASLVQISIALETHEEHLLTSHHGLICHTCGSSTRLHISSVLTDEQRENSPWQQTNILSVPFQTAARDRPAPLGLTRTWTRLRAPQQARAQTPFTLTNKIHPLGT